VAGILLAPAVFALELAFAMHIGPEKRRRRIVFVRFGNRLGLFFSFKGLETAAKHKLRLWIDGRLFQPNDLGQAPSYGRANRMFVILLATGVSFSVCMEFVIYAAFGRGQNLFDPRSWFFWFTLFPLAWPCLLLVCCQRIIARRPEECWKCFRPGSGTNDGTGSAIPNHRIRGRCLDPRRWDPLLPGQVLGRPQAKWFPASERD